jgi:prevent-host-death family protein
MTRLNATKVREDFSDTLNRVAYRGERILLERRGRVVAAIVPAEDLQLLEDLEDRLDLEEARAALRQARRKRTIPWEKVKAKLGL